MQAAVGRAAVRQPSDQLDLGTLGRAVWRRKGPIIGLTLLAAAVAFAAVSVVTPRYKSQARLLVETRENIFLPAGAEKSAERGASVDQEAVTSQMQLILSRDLARNIIKKLKLDERPEFDPVLRGTSLIEVLLVDLGLINDPLSQTPEERVLKSYFDRLTASSVDKSRVIAIDFESEDPELAVRAADAIAEGYLALQRAAKQDQSGSPSQWLYGQIENLRGRVAEAESKVEQYRAHTNLLVGNTNTSLSDQQLGDFNAQLAAAHAQKADAEARARIIRDALQSMAPVQFSGIVDSELMRQLSQRRGALQVQLAAQSSALLDQHPRLKKLRAQIFDLDRQLRLEADRLARSLENDAKMADARVRSLSASLDQLRALEREAKSQRDLLESYLAKYRQATAHDSTGTASPEARVISSAVVSTTPDYPKKLATILVATLGMLVLTVGCVLARQLLRAVAPGASAPATRYVPRSEPVIGTTTSDEIRASPQDAMPAAGEPSTTEAPTPPHELRVARGGPLDAIENLARALGAAGTSGRCIAIIGARRNAGTTQAAIFLARALAKQGTVALIDLSFGSPEYSGLASDPTTPGISELIAGTSSFGQIITRDRFSRVHLVMTGRAELDGEAVLSSVRLSITLEALARTYDRVVVDAGALPDVPLDRFAELAPGAVLVTEGHDDPAIASARQRLIAAGFADVSVLATAPRGPDLGVSKGQAAA